jgi:hypothetical protein
MMLALGRRALDYSPRIREMLGYSIHPPFMGMVDGMHPSRLIDDGYDPASTGGAPHRGRFLGRRLSAKTSSSTPMAAGSSGAPPKGAVLGSESAATPLPLLLDVDRRVDTTLATLSAEKS